jgi:hypothetical protein
MLRSISTRVAGLTILVLGIWGGIIPFVGPLFHFTLGPDHAWTWTSGRLYLDVLPAIAAVIGGLWLIGAGPWASGRLGALLALGAGIWFAIGPDLSYLWQSGGQEGAGHGSTTVQMLERLSFHTGLGVLIAALAGYALPGLLARRKAAVAEGTAATGTAAPVAPAPGRTVPADGAPAGARTAAPANGAVAPANGAGETVPAEDETAIQTPGPVRRERAGV